MLHDIFNHELAMRSSKKLTIKTIVDDEKKVSAELNEQEENLSESKKSCDSDRSRLEATSAFVDSEVRWYEYFTARPPLKIYEMRQRHMRYCDIVVITTK